MEQTKALPENQAKIKEFLSRYFKNHDLQPEEDIFALGFVNSLLAMQLVAFVEKECAIRVEEEDLDLDNFRSIQAISNLVARKTGALPTAAMA